MKEIKGKKPKYYLDANGEFVIENYNFAKPFANFFPGIAGKYGIPMWVFYVNRAQAISSFGTRDKDHAILEFFPANKAWQLTPSQGFRTFIKVGSRENNEFYEPFRNDLTNLGFETSNKMSISSYGLKLQEDNLSLGLKIKVEYFNIPQDSYAGLVRIVSVKNTSKVTRKIQVLDGLPQIIPFGTSNLFLKKLGRTIEAWMNVENMDKGVPFYKLAVDPTDRPEVIHISEGNFYLSFYHEGKKTKIIKPIIDPQHIFGAVNDFLVPYEFLANANFGVTKNETVQSKTPCGFSLVDLKLSAQEEKTFYTVIGYMRTQEILNSSIKKITSPGYILQKKEENKRTIEELQSDIETSSNSREFDLYAKQTYLDNIIRGGRPAIFSRGREQSTDKKQVFYLYARKHGDLERDYNKFYIQPSYFSQGNGNYRDMNQNRRLDVWFNPDIEDENIIYFFNLIQTDGFNPLVVKGANFLLKNITEFRNELKKLTNEEYIREIISFLDNRPFTPGEVILFLQDKKIKLKTSPDGFLDLLICSSLKIQEAEHGEGFWTDHWTYALDLLESFLGIYPEKLKEIIFEEKKFTFFDNTEIVKPRSEKYLLDQGKVKQLHSVKPDNHKRELIKKRAHQPHLVRMQNGEGEIYQTCLINKLLCLLVNKLSSLDPSGTGIEMEADKPNWFDALNGLPALLGSSGCETFELKRLIKFIKHCLQLAKVEKIYVTEEIYGFLTSLE
ncbi:MAG: cellobiose phosphorylase, partial [Candidatus Omnitrophica bacterium]|nr:cellobiose phosphorylase [Candidatus Omnitrophota bacterium]